MTKKEYIEKYGTPESFEKAIWKAFEDLFINYTEAINAIRHFNIEYNNSPDK